LSPVVLRTALADPHPGVVRQAVRLCEPWLGIDEAVAEAVLAAGDRPEPPVRFQIALSLGFWHDPRAGAALGRLAVHEGGAGWTRPAVLSAAPSHAAAILAAVVAPGVKAAVRTSLVEPLILTLTAGNDPESLEAAVSAITRSESDGTIAAWRLAALAALLD